MLNTQLVQDVSNQQYKILRSKDTVPGNLKPISISNESDAKAFTQKLMYVPLNYWRNLVSSQSLSGGTHNLSEHDVKALVHKQLSNGQLKAFIVDSKATNNIPVEKLVVKNGNGFSKFAKASTLLINQPTNYKQFNNDKDADEYLKTLNVSDEQLTDITKCLDLNEGKDVLDPYGAVLYSLARGEIIIIVDNTSSVPADKNQNDETVATDKSPGPGPETEEAYAAGGVAGGSNLDKDDDKEKQPPCTLDHVTIQCSHGRNTGITNKTKNIPTLAVISTETVEKEFDLITAKIHAGELCDSHKLDRFSISPEHNVKSKSPTEVDFKVCCDTWNVENFFDRIWLPSVSPKTYTFSINDFCKTADINVYEIKIDVYPQMKWHWKTNINFGKLEFVPGETKFEYSGFEVGKDTDVTLTYDNKPHNAKEKFNQYITEPMEGFKNICEKISKVLEFINDPEKAIRRIGTNAVNKVLIDEEEDKESTDGNTTKLEVTWPNLDIVLDSEIYENKKYDLIDHEYTLNITADPLLHIALQVDVIDALTTIAPTGTKEVLEFARERIKKGLNAGKNVKFKGEIDIIFTIDTKIDIKSSEVSEIHNPSKTVRSAKPIKGDIEIPATIDGKVQAEGKFFIISFDVKYSVISKAGWKGSYEIARDDTGVYFSPSIEFTGIKITFTKYKEAKAEIESTAKKLNKFDKYNKNIETKNGSVKVNSDGETTKVEAEIHEESEEEWTWLEPEKDDNKDNSSNKYYIMKN